MGERIQVRAGDFIGIHYPRDGSSAVSYRYGGSQSVRHHKFTAFDENVLANHITVAPVYTTALKKPALKAYVRSKIFCAYLNQPGRFWLLVLD